MKIATQEDIDDFMQTSMFDKDIYPYLTTSKTINAIEYSKTDWNFIFLISENGKCFLKIQIDRTRDNEFSISLYSKNCFQAGRAITVIKELITRYQPRAINSVVHASNSKSLKLHNKIFGEPWGIENSAAWNSLKGEYEDLYCFRKIINK